MVPPAHDLWKLQKGLEAVPARKHLCLWLCCSLNDMFYHGGSWWEVTSHKNPISQIRLLHSLSELSSQGKYQQGSSILLIHLELKRSFSHKPESGFMQFPDLWLLRGDAHMALMNPYSGISCKSLTIDYWILQAGLGYTQKQHPGLWRALPHVCPTSPLLFIFMPYSRPFSFVFDDFPDFMFSQRN